MPTWHSSIVSDIFFEIYQGSTAAECLLPCALLVTPTLSACARVSAVGLKEFVCLSVGGGQEVGVGCLTLSSISTFVICTLIVQIRLSQMIQIAFGIYRALWADCASAHVRVAKGVCVCECGISHLLYCVSVCYVRAVSTFHVISHGRTHVDTSV